MTPDPAADSAAALADLLEAENSALRSLDFPRVTALLPEKQRLATAITAPPGPAILRRLQVAATENRSLLERAIAIQGRVVGIVAQAAAPKARGYSARGFAAAATGRPLYKVSC